MKEENVHHAEELTALDVALRCIRVEEQEEATATNIMLLKRWRDIATRKCVSTASLSWGVTMIYICVENITCYGVPIITSR